MSSTSRRRLLAATVFGVVAFGMAACSAAPSSHPQGDVEFAQMMIPHHQQALAMSELAAAKAEDTDIKAIAQEITAAQQPEIATLTGWLASWGQPTSQPGGHHMPGMDTMPGMMTDEQMSRLRSTSGKDFDRAYAELMISHHNGAIEMADQVLGTTSDADVKAFAQRVVAAQTAEVSRLQKILDRL